MKNLRFTLLAALLVTASGVAHAQAPAAPAAVTGATADTGTISNAATETTTTTTTATPGIGPTDETVMTGATDSTTQLPNTGGEPLLVTFAGLSMAAGAFFLRRRVTG